MRRGYNPSGKLKISHVYGFTFTHVRTHVCVCACGKVVKGYKTGEGEKEQYPSSSLLREITFGRITWVFLLLILFLYVM